MPRYIYYIEFNKAFAPEFLYGCPTLNSRGYNAIRSKCRYISRRFNIEGECNIYRVKGDKAVLNSLFTTGASIVKNVDSYSVGNIVFNYIGKYSHCRDDVFTREFYADWTLGRDALTRHSMSVITYR